MTERYAYKRVLLKLSGDALAGEGGTGLDFGVMSGVCRVITEAAKDGVQVGVVIGGVNETNCEQFNGTGIDGLAVVSAIIAKPDVEAAARELRSLFRKIVNEI